MPSWTNDTLAYLSGIIDGEGWIGISRRKTKLGGLNYILKVTITNTDENLINWFRIQDFGCRFYKRKPNVVGNKDIYFICFQNKEALNILELCEPFLIVKRGLAIEILKNYPRTNKKIPQIREQVFNTLNNIRKGE